MEQDALNALVATQIKPDGPGVAVAVVRGGQVVYQHCCGLACLEWCQPIAPDTVMALASLTKPFTAQAILLLEDANQLHLSDSIASYLPDVRWLYPNITIAHLLTHTSGAKHLSTRVVR